MGVNAALNDIEKFDSILLVQFRFRSATLDPE